MATYDTKADPGYYLGCAKCKKIATCIDPKAMTTRAALERKRAGDEAVAKLVRN